MPRKLPILNAVPGDHSENVIVWSLFNGHNSDSVEASRSFVAEQSIAIEVRSLGASAEVTVSDGVGEITDNLASTGILVVQTTGFGERVGYHIKVKARNNTNKLTAFGAPLSLLIRVFTTARPAPLPPPAPRPPQPQPVPPTIPPPVSRMHTVRPGEYLQLIAKTYYSDANKWTDIYSVNKSIIGPNPNLIHPGQRLRIP